ncbi:LysR family transcriptional regulator [Roseovarius sp. SCSIO 43702]|uniref:LysR substrate-binding domain-containing protein n=1 Tax=Roseovarius sp. SCSIO 43702 TaxID=2823043 RepID=UPI001C72E58E|nr:LysR substrate-binding domain-containing protein [Roseovarius sp. SCSIO 43702]QYX55572.1 LysR family transcriptional regulator [Roseovarius sp. SCSIO 43702]
MSHLPSLSALRSFQAAARHQSFTLAADELSLTQGAISRQVRELEEAMGLRLFRRAGRAVQLTDAGRAFAADLEHDLGRLKQSVARAIAAGDGARILSIAVLPTFGSRWLMPRLPEFRTRHPEIELSFMSRTEPFDLEAERCDLAIHFGHAEWPGARLTPLCPEDLLAVAAPGFLRAHDIRDAEDLGLAPLLHLSSRPSAWTDFMAEFGAEGRPARSGMQFDQFSLMISACVQGLGAALLPSYLIEEELDSGALDCVARASSVRSGSYHIATPLGADRPETRAFVEWIIRQVPRRAA